MHHHITARREVLKMILGTISLPLAAYFWRQENPPKITPLVPVQLDTEGKGFSRDLNGRVHEFSQFEGIQWRERLKELRINGRLVKDCTEFNLEEGWCRVLNVESITDTSEPPSVLLRGTVTVSWLTP